MENTEIIERLAAVEEARKSNTKRIDNIEKKVEDIHELIYSVRELATETKAMREDVNKLDSRVGNIEKEPYNKYKSRKDDIVKQAISFFFGIILMFIAFKLGLSNYV